MTLAGWAKKLTGKFTAIVGGVGFDKGMYATMSSEDTEGINNLPDVVEVFNRGECDLVQVGRAILNDPAWAHKAVRGQKLPPFYQENLEKLV